MSLGTAGKAAQSRASMENIWHANVASAVSLLPPDFDAMQRAKDLAHRLEDLWASAAINPELTAQRIVEGHTTSVSRLTSPDKQAGYPPVRVEASAHYNIAGNAGNGFQTVQYPSGLCSVEASFTTPDGLELGAGSSTGRIQIASELGGEPSPQALGRLCVMQWAVEALEMPATPLPTASS